MSSTSGTREDRPADLAEERYRLLLENANDAVYVHQISEQSPGRFLEVNQRACEMLGYTPEEFLAMEVTEIDVPEQRGRLGDIISELYETGRALFQTEHVTKDGSRVPVEVSTRLFDLHGTPTVLSVVRDVSDRKRAEEALRRSEARYVTFLNATDDIAFLKDDGLRYLLVNEANAKLLGRPAEEIIGLRDAELMTPEVAANCRVSDRRALERGATVIEEEVVDDRVFEVRKFPVALEDGRTGVGGYIRDVTEQQAAGAALEKSAERLRGNLIDTVRAMGAIVDLRDPYTAQHQRSVTRLAQAIGSEMGLDEDRLEGLMLAGEVHDIGKIAVPAEILSKPSALTTLERTIVQQHPVVGRRVLGEIDFRQPVADIVGQHHERLDGSGYPDGLGDEEILFEARILAVADVVEAMAAHRPYRPALGIETAISEIREGVGTRYDGEVAAACERVIEAGFELHG